MSTPHHEEHWWIRPPDSSVHVMTRDERVVVEEGELLLRPLALAIGLAPSLDAGLGEAVRLIAERNGWSYGEAWRIDGEGSFRAGASWSRPGATPSELAVDLAGIRVVSGFGLAGMVVDDPTLRWFPDLAALPSTSFLRREEAMREGYCSAVALPAVAEGRVEAILIFFLREMETPTEATRRALEEAVEPLGWFLRHKVDEDRIRTEHRALEHRLAESARHLASLSERIRESDRWTAVDRLARGVVHDLANATFPLRCHLDLLRMSEIPADARVHVDAAMEAVACIVRLGENLRALVRRDEGDAPAGRTDLSAWWAEHRRVIEGMLTGADRSLEVRWSDDLPELAIAPEVLLRALQFVAGGVVDGGRTHLGAITDIVGLVAISIERQRPVPSSPRRRHHGSQNLEDPALPGVRRALEQVGGSLAIEHDRLGLVRATILVPTTPHSSSPRKVMLRSEDGRIRAILESILHTSGLEEASTPDDPVAKVAIVDGASPHAREFVRGFLAEDAGRRVVVVGGRADEWVGIPAAFVAEIANLRAIREELERNVASAGRHGRTTPILGDQRCR